MTAKTVKTPKVAQAGGINTSDIMGTVEDLASKQLGKSFDQDGDGDFDKQDIFTLAFNYVKKKFLGGK